MESSKPIADQSPEPGKNKTKPKDKTKESDKSYKLYYSEGNCRAMLSRALLSYAEAPFQNIILDKKQLHEYKKTKEGFEFGVLPVLEYKNETFEQDIAVQSYLCRKFKLFGKSLIHQCKILSLFVSYDDLLYYIHEAMTPKKNSPDPKRDYFMNLKKFEAKLEIYVKVYEANYIKNGCGEYYFGNEFTAADIFFAVVLYYFADIIDAEKKIVKSGPNIWKLAQKVKENQLKNFFEKEYLEGKI